MVRNHRLAKARPLPPFDGGRVSPSSITDASWTMFREWIEYFGKVYGVVTVAVPPHNTSQNCSNCGKKVVKSLSTRTHKCHHCGASAVLGVSPMSDWRGYVADRDENAARNILEIGLRTVGHTPNLRLPRERPLLN